MFLAYEKLEVLDENTDIFWERVKGKLIVANRDYTVLNHRLYLPDGTIVSSGHSVDRTAQRPPEKGDVRAEVILAGYIFIPIPGTETTKVIYVFQVDPKGMVPKTLVNLAAKMQCNCINRLRYIFEPRDGAKEPEKIDSQNGHMQSVSRLIFLIDAYLVLHLFFSHSLLWLVVQSDRAVCLCLSFIPLSNFINSQSCVIDD
eukprot:TRINITY_DN2269_c0_g1_i10.p1 TRINITY_DN2269_c0_g1~~TRINITY_DN2269_c0_g1_i10.p1  ORF type:complete len:201 (-),score=33.41 TRINITY_DN2269_c0_g1_i10:108-710(-)